MVALDNHYSTSHANIVNKDHHFKQGEGTLGGNADYTVNLIVRPY